ncbi:Spy/CpxP family protein refolding chaperone [Propylenella binzhouense]|uniref:Uncharacterized protein n=1 Tax=Propylenella binzhouense TaxID=2555902 RepID=A0A964T0X7_9HYPH|nr:hypothetical protein [Propylenella binzhouense]MYZ46321.1 hypothetical protein [Propylenella binzhouense]
MNSNRSTIAAAVTAATMLWGSGAMAQDSQDHEAPAQGQPGWPTLLERHETALAARLEMVRNIRPAAEALYQELDETQQRLASELAGGLIGAP